MLTDKRRGHRSNDDDGSILVLLIGYTAIALVLITVAVDVSKVFLAERALAAAADSAALAGAQGVDTQSIYDGPALRCGEPLPLDSGRASRLVARSVEQARPDLKRSFVTLADPQTTLAGGTVTVVLTGDVGVPFGRVVSWLDPSRPDGLVQVSESSHARSPVAGADC